MARETVVRVLELESGAWVLLLTLSTRDDTRLVTIDPTTGALCHTSQRGLDVFPSERAAYQHATNGGATPCKSSVQGRALLGYCALGPTALLLIATRVRPTVRSLPGGDTVWTVSESQWVKIPLRCPLAGPLSKGEAKAVSELTDVLISDVHFFCETRDLTRPFPSPFPVHSPDPEFVWNQWLTAPLRALGLKEHCAVLLQVRSHVCASSQPEQVNLQGLVHAGFGRVVKL